MCVSGRGGNIEPTKDKKAIRNFPHPKTKKDLRAWLGLTGYYRKFIGHFASRTANMTDAQRKDSLELLKWDETLEAEFKDMKTALTSQPILQPTRPYILATDASGCDIGAVLSQEDGEIKPIAYFSMKLQNVQARYTTTEQETLAATKGMQHFVFHLLGKKFIMETDH